MTEEPAWCAVARDRIDEVNYHVRAALRAERKRIVKAAMKGAMNALVDTMDD
jgi:hypothetical protein